MNHQRPATTHSGSGGSSWNLKHFTRRGALGLMGLSALGGSGIITSSPSQGLTLADEATVTALAEVVASYPSQDAASVMAARAPAAVERMRSYYSALAPAARREARTGVRWWRQHVVLTSADSTRQALQRLGWENIAPYQRHAAVAACSLAIVQSVPGITGASHSVAGLWLSGLSGSAVAPWRRV